MNHIDIKNLLSINGYPAVSIMLPTHRTWPENQQDHIRLRNLIAEASTRLLAEFPRREIEPILLKLEELIQGIDYRYLLDGLAVFVNQE